MLKIKQKMTTEVFDLASEDFDCYYGTIICKNEKKLCGREPIGEHLVVL